MILRVVLLFIVFVVVRILALKSSGKPAHANIAAAGIVVAYVAGLLGQGLPQFERDTFAPNDVVAVVERQEARDTSDPCRNAPQQSSPGGLGSFDYVLDANEHPLPVAARYQLDRKRTYHLSGWAAERDGLHPALAVCPVLDGHVFGNASSFYGGGRPDVAASLHAPLLGSSGYLITIGANAIAPGNHTLGIAVISHEHDAFTIARDVAVSVR